MNIPSIINHNYYVVRDTRANRTWICEAERFDDKDMFTIIMVLMNLVVMNIKIIIT